jgi:TetR/AcrR family transcriptional regulator, transcriptional repressor for nem operon
MAGTDAAARPRLTPKGHATRERIIRAAAGLISGRGVGRTSIEDVRKAAGVSGSQMTHYFTDKQSLVCAVIGWQADQLAEFCTQPRLGGLDTFGALRQWADLSIGRLAARHGAGGCDFGSLAGELAESGPATRAELAAGYQRWHGLLRAGLQAMRDRGELRADADPGALAFALLAAHQGGALLTQAGRDVAPLRAALDAALGYVQTFATGAARH